MILKLPKMRGECKVTFERNSNNDKQLTGVFKGKRSEVLSGLHDMHCHFQALSPVS